MSIIEENYLKPDHITEEQYNQWLAAVEADPLIPANIKTDADALEVCIAGHWLKQELDKLKCPADLQLRIFFTYGQLAYEGDPWKMAQLISQEYASGSLVFEDDELDLMMDNKRDKFTLN
jgi:hypothetical protein